MDSAKRAMSGTHGSVWLDNDLVSECYGLQAKGAFNKEDIPMCGSMGNDFKIKSVKYTGSLKLYKVNSRMAIKVGEAIRAGKDVRFNVISKLADPDAYGAERVSLKGVSFDDLTLADWEADVTGKVECPFTFTDFEYLDKVEVRT
ncbi:phage tail tube protein [Hydrogenoanaerobacterium sp.]|uniref:phage tail tube protein n=1 Tax=Hydrogenoanaerobacterium sp. TaxID=2953763 RepID=UPI0028A19AD0|nr:phage tail tube protein [Hydrogenoanaerobacterium sp.]